jgi:hypothetical protein
MAVKFKTVFNQMMADNQELFAQFALIHQQYDSNQTKYQDKFNQVGEQILEAVREYENRLCSHSEKGKYAKYSANLAEKFKTELKKQFPLIDFIGVKTDLDIAIDGMKKLI